MSGSAVTDEYYEIVGDVFSHWADCCSEDVIQESSFCEVKRYEETLEDDQIRMQMFTLEGKIPGVRVEVKMTLTFPESVSEKEMSETNNTLKTQQMTCEICGGRVATLLQASDGESGTPTNACDC